MDLRDRFAAHFAAALVDAFVDAGQVAERAYDLAEAMMVERARRIDAEEGNAIAFEPRRASAPPPSMEWSAPALSSTHGALLDEPEPMFEYDPPFEDELDPSWLEPPYDPSWDLETRWNAETPSPVTAVQATPPRSGGPGLVRTQPDQPGEAGAEETRRERSA